MINIFKRKKAELQDYINFIGVILFLWVIISKTILIGDMANIFVSDNLLILACLITSIEMLVVNTIMCITNFKNWRYDVRQNKKGYNIDGKNNEEEKT